ncbi:lipid-A-disaccharide synthase [Lacibacterium aquatile]|uniref:Lipid-A-disaccharide synthase n=1 Tax=Lacibacterium aquatile TaxID=1168082 RepID=A0ABW5DJY0_9PROT
MSATPPHFFLVAGEISGDLIGGRLMASLKKRLGPDVRFSGVGGPAMTAEGLESLFPMQELSLMGLAEVLPHIPALLKRLSQTEAAVRAERPTALITIDAPSFTLRLAKSLGDAGIPRIHYVAPQVWAWRAGRAPKIARKIDRLLALFPFEPPWFTKHGLPTDYVGHPVVEGGALSGDGDRFRERYGIPASKPLLTVLPGSRQGEVTRLLPVFAATVELLAEQVPGLQLVVPTVPQVADRVAEAIRSWPGDPLLVTDSVVKFDAFAASRAALAASGTVALELALAKLPAVIAYKVNPFTAWMLRRLLTIRYAALPNLILDEPLMPELLQEDCNPAAIAKALAPLMLDTPVRGGMLEGYQRLADAMELDLAPPSERAAEVICRHVGLG